MFPRPQRLPLGPTRSADGGRALPGRTHPSHLGGLAAGWCAALLTLALATPSGGATSVSTGGSRPPSSAGSSFVGARLRYGGGGDWYSGGSLLNLMRFVRERAGIPVEGDDEVKVGVGDEELFDYPFVFMNGHGEVKFTDSELANLRRYLDNGGFLFANDDYGMDASFRRELRRLFPESPLVDIPNDHAIYHSFYDLPGVPKIHAHDNKPAQGMGLFRNGRMVVYYAYESDIGDGLEDADVHHDPEAVREAATKMGVNIVVYAMTH